MECNICRKAIQTGERVEIYVSAEADVEHGESQLVFSGVRYARLKTGTVSIRTRHSDCTAREGGDHDERR